MEKGRKQIQTFIEGLFADAPDKAEAKRAKETLLASLEEKYRTLRQQGMEDQEAATQVLMDFGAKEGVAAAILQEHLKTAYDKFLRHYPVLRRIGILGLLIAPFAIAFLFSSIDTKVTALVSWVTAVFLFIAYIICIEYMDYHYKKRLHLSSQDRPSAEIQKASPEAEVAAKGMAGPPSASAYTLTTTPDENTLDERKKGKGEGR